MGIDALGELDRYKEVFDIDYYRKHKKWYIQQLLGKHDYIELATYFKDEITFVMHCRALPYKILGWFPILRGSNIHKTIKKWIKK